MPGSGRTTGGSGAGARARLLDAAVRVGAAEGWGGITTRAVANAAGMPQGLVHYHFGSVPDLRRAAVGHCLGALAEAALGGIDAVGTDGSGVDAEVALRRLVARLATTDPDDHLGAFLFESFVAARRDDRLREELAGAVGSVRREVAAWVDGMTAGDPDRTDPAAVATLIVAALDGIYLHRMLDDRIDVEAVVVPLARLLARHDAASGSVDGGSVDGGSVGGLSTGGGSTAGGAS